MDKKILITGATGLIGKSIVSELVARGAFVKILTTNPKKAVEVFKKHYTAQIFDLNKYEESVTLSELVEDSDAIINLAGENVSAKRWNKGFKQKLYRSRIDTTRLIVDAIGYCEKKPECLVNASGVGIYGFRGDEMINEDEIPGDDFLAKLCKDWEIEAFKAIQFDVRVITLRTGIVLDKNGGALKEFLTPFKFGFGAYQGTGSQWLSWIHIKDITDLYIFVIENTKMFGAINATSPNPVTNKEFVRTIGEVLRRNLILPVPGPFLKIGLGEFAENLLTGQRVFPAKMLESGFEFSYPVLKDSLTNLLMKDSSDVN